MICRRLAEIKTLRKMKFKWYVKNICLLIMAFFRENGHVIFIKFGTIHKKVGNLP